MATIKNNFFSKACLQSRLFSLLFLSRCRSLRSKAEVRTRQHSGFFMRKICDLV
nr:MAG TPA: hypothetical protein [Bacteriophage sp.]DAY29024.1 MAG TPA: hypothetical protein [Bacteriophage sp.]